MYLCVCNAIKEADFRRAARESGGSVEAIYAMLGVEPQCGSCLFEAEDILLEEHGLVEVPAFAA